MTEYTYKVLTIETIEGETVTKFARLVAHGSNPAGATFPQEICMSIPNVRPGDIIKISTTKLKRTSSTPKLADKVSKAERTVHFLHHYDRKNQGDVLSGPYNYFEFSNIGKISWDKQIIDNGAVHFSPGDDLIMGGGIYFTRNKVRLDNLLKQTRNFIGWGIGLDERLNEDKFYEKYTLLGTRERHSSFIDNKKIFYVPCASCMHPTFNRSPENTVNESNRVAIHINGGFNEKEVIRTFEGQSFTTTVDDFSKIIENISSAECVVTNSYHGAYWGSLLGKKVVLIKTSVPKWSGLHKDIVVTDAEEIIPAIESAQRIPSSYLDECRALNEDFNKKVVDLIAAD